MSFEVSDFFPYYHTDNAVASLSSFRQLSPVQKITIPRNAAVDPFDVNARPVSDSRQSHAGDSFFPVKKATRPGLQVKSQKGKALPREQTFLLVSIVQKANPFFVPFVLLHLLTS